MYYSSLIRLIISILLGMGIISTSAYSQLVDSLLANQYSDRGNEFVEKLQYDSAVYYFDQAAKSYAQADLCEKYLFSLIMKAYYVWQSTDNQQAIDIFHNLLPKADSCLSPDHHYFGLINNYLGTLNQIKGNFDRALEHYHTAQPLFEARYIEPHDRLAEIYYSMGTCYYYKGEFGQSLDYFQKHVQVEGQVKPGKIGRLASGHQNIGNCLRNMGDFDQSISHYHRSMDIRASGPKYKEADQAVTYVLLGLAYEEKGSFKEALKWHRKAIPILKQASQLHFANHIYGLMSIGRIHQANEMTDSALVYFQEALELQKPFENYIGPHVADVYLKIGEIYAGNNNYDDALVQYQIALDKRKSYYSDRHPLVAETWLAFGKLMRDQHRYEEAFSFIQKAFIANTRSFSDSLNDAYVALDQVFDPYRMLEIQASKAEIYHEWAEHVADRDIQIHLHTLAITNYQHFATFTHNLRRKYKIESSKLHLLDHTRPVFENAIQSCYKLFRMTGDPLSLHKAFQIAEQSKSMLLSDAVQAAGALQFAGIPASLIEQEMQLKQELEYLIQKARTSKERGEWEGKRFETERKYEKFIQKLESDYPQYYKLKYQNDLINIADIQRILPPQTVLLSYFCGDKSAWVFTLSASNLSLDTISNELLTPEKIRDYYSKVSQFYKSDDSLLNYSARLYHQLINHPLRTHPKASQLILVPDGVLGYLPFDLLLTKLPENSDYRSYPWLIRKYLISYAYSTHLLKENIEHEGNNNTWTYAGFAPIYGHQSLAMADVTRDYSGIATNLPDLPGAREEVTFANSLFNGNIFLAEAATEHQLKQLRPPPAILHLAMHATLNNKDPLKSHLQFGISRDTLDDGILHAYEIYNLALSSQLTVLSACNTGIGEIRRGEGIMSLSRAFMYAGCPSILTTLWRTKDQPAQQIVSSFFQYIHQGLSKGKALHKAKLDFLDQADPLQAHPSNWANFILIGNPGPLQQGIPVWIWILLAGIICGLAGFFIYSSNKK